MSSSISNDIIIVAGAGKGIGLAVVKNILAEFPEKKILAISRNTSNLDFFKNTGHLIVVNADLASLSTENIKFINSQIQTDNLKGIIFTAGVLDKYPIPEIKKENFESIFQNNLWSFIELIKSVYSSINSTTHIVSIGSMGGITGTQKFKGMSLYSTSKAALSLFTECLAEELKEIGASANCLAIGAVNTEMMKKAFPDYSANIDPESMAEFIVDFTINRKNLFNGQVIPVTSTNP